MCFISIKMNKEASMEGTKAGREESLRETVDRNILACRSGQDKIEEVTAELIRELLPPEHAETPEQPTINPQGWFEELHSTLVAIRDSQRSTEANLVRLRKAVRAGELKAVK